MMPIRRTVTHVLDRISKNDIPQTNFGLYAENDPRKNWTSVSRVMVAITQVVVLMCVFVSQLHKAITQGKQIYEELKERDAALVKAMKDKPAFKAEFRTFRHTILEAKLDIMERLLGFLDGLVEKATPVDLRISNWANFFSGMIPKQIETYLGIIAMGRYLFCGILLCRDSCCTSSFMIICRSSLLVGLEEYMKASWLNKGQGCFMGPEAEITEERLGNV
jgi:hypothetical protein